MVNEVSYADECSPSPVMSENYIVFIEQPIKLDLMKYMWYKIQGKSFHKIMSWEPQYETVFHLVNRHTGEVSPFHVGLLHARPRVGAKPLG